MSVHSEHLRIYDLDTADRDRFYDHVHLPHDFSPEEMRLCIRALLCVDPTLPVDEVYQQYEDNLLAAGSPILFDTKAVFMKCYFEVLAEYSHSS